MKENNMFYYCTVCGSFYTQKEHLILKMKSKIISLGFGKTQCPSCHKFSDFIKLNSIWAKTIYILNSKGYSISTCSSKFIKQHSTFAFIQFKSPLKSVHKPKLMSFFSKWSYDRTNNCFFQENRDSSILQYEYSREEPFDEQLKIISSELYRWAMSLPKKTA